MGLFRKSHKANEEKAVRGNTKTEYNLADLEQKVRTKTPMTSDEFDALQRERMKDVMNKVLRIFGVCALLFIVVLAIGCFLYPYSLFNLFGEGDKFWDCWSHIQFHLQESDIVKINDATGQSIDVVNGWGWANVSDMMNVAFQGTSAKLNFLVLGSWSVILVATIGIIGTVIMSAYIVAYNIKDLIVVIRHIGKGGAAVISDVANTAVESVESASSSNGRRKPTKKAPASTKKRADEKDLFADDDSVVSSIEKVSSEEQDEKPEPVVERRKENSGISSEDLDRLLSGEDIRH